MDDAGEEREFGENSIGWAGTFGKGGSDFLAELNLVMRVLTEEVVYPCEGCADGVTVSMSVGQDSS